MKKVIFTFSMLLMSIMTYAQNCYWTENMEAIDSVSSVGTPGFNANTVYYQDGVQSVLGTYNAGDSAILSTTDIDLAVNGSSYVILKFWHICKMSFFDAGTIEVSNDGGNTWTQLTGAQYLGGSPNFAAQGNKFSEAAYPKWQPGNAGALPDSSWWQQEIFDISALVAYSPNARVRFVAHDLNNSGLEGRLGWLIDNICVEASPCETNPPTFTQAAPVLTGTVYNLGPFTLNAYVNDQSTVAGVYLFYQINGGGFTNVIPMVNPLGDSVFTGDIPAVSNGDTVCYFFYTFDGSACANELYYPQPAGNSICFIASSGITFPYCDNFDINDLWSATNVTGSPWELGTPTYGLTNSAHTAPNAWDIELGAPYQQGTEAYLLSPVLDFQNAVNTRMTFWYNSATDNFGQDGTTLEYSSLSGPWQVLDVALDPSAQNWYNVTNLTSSNKPGWGGNSNGWKQAKFNLSAFDGSGALQLRFGFRSGNFSSNDGFSIDDFCVIQPPPADMGVDLIKEPFPSGGAGQTSNSIVRVRNYGTTIVNNFDVYYSWAGNVVGPTAYTGVPLNPNDTAIITMPTFIIPSGVYDYCAWTSMPGDGDASNDTLCMGTKGIPVVAISYCNDFDVNGNDWTNTTPPGTGTDWELGTPNYGATNSSYSAPNSWDINLNSAYTNNATATLLSPFFDFTGKYNVDLNFWQNRNCENAWDGTRIEYSQNGGAWTVLGSSTVLPDPLGVNWYNDLQLNSSQLPAWTGNSGGWVKSIYNMSQFNNSGLLQFQFVFTSDPSVITDGFTIDNFCLHEPQPIDVGVDSILSPTANAGAGQIVDVTVRVRNFGSQPNSAFDVYYVYAGTTYGPASYTGPALAPGATTLITITPQLTVPVGAFCIQAYTSLATDQDHTNDSINGCMFGVPVDTLNYCTDFEGALVDWTSTAGGGSNWELGTPSYGLTTGAHSGVNAWDVNLNTAYTNNANTSLFSPFFDFSTAVNAQLSVWRNNNSEQGWDGTRIDYSLGGSPWNVLGSTTVLPDPNGVNWYNDLQLNSSQLPAWTGNSNGWVKSEYNMSQFNNEPALVQFRFIFTSDPSVITDGFSIDDFCIRIPPPFDGGVVSIDAPIQQGLAIGSSNPITVTIRNYGQNIISNFPVVYTVNGANPQTTIFTGSLAPNATATIPLVPNFTAIPLSMDLCAWTVVPNDGDPTNDTTCANYVGVPSYEPTFTDNFDGPNQGWTTASADPATKWEYGTPNYNTTTGAYSPPNCWDINLNTVYFPNANAQLISPYYDFTNVVKGEFSFYQNYKYDQFQGEGMHVDYSIDGGNTWNLMGSTTTPAQYVTNWYNTANIFSSGTEGWNGSSFWAMSKYKDYNGDMDGQPNVRFRFVFTSDGFVNGGDGVSVDDIMIYRPIPNTAATTDVKATYGILQPGPQSLTGTLKNTGYIKLTSVAVTLKVDGIVQCTDTINPTPTPGGVPFDSTFTHTFSCLWNASPGAHDICIYTSYPNQTPDEFTDDDTTCVTLTVFDTISNYPYCNTFESGQPQWVALNSSAFTIANCSWEFGTPTKVNINGAHSGANAWATKLNVEYPNLDESSLFTPVFNVQQGKCYEMNFWHNFDMDLFNDGGAIEYTTDSAKTWKTLGDFGDQLNWYNAVYVAAFGNVLHAGFTGYYGAWVQSKHNFVPLQSGTVIFRFRFSSDQTNNADGWAIDDFCFFQDTTGTCTMTGVNQLLSNDFYLSQNAPNPFNGTTTISYNLPKSGVAKLTITNLVGQVISIPVNGNVTEGSHSIALNSKDFAPGIYYYTLNYDNKKIVRKMIITE